MTDSLKGERSTGPEEGGDSLYTHETSGEMSRPKRERRLSRFTMTIYQVLYGVLYPCVFPPSHATPHVMPARLHAHDAIPPALLLRDPPHVLPPCVLPLTPRPRRRIVRRPSPRSLRSQFVLHPSDSFAIFSFFRCFVTRVTTSRLQIPAHWPFFC